MTSDYERKIAEKTARRIVRSATNEWMKYGNVEIGTIIKRKGFYQPWNTFYKYKKNLWTGTRSYLVTLDTYDLVHHRDGKITYTIEE